MNLAQCPLINLIHFFRLVLFLFFITYLINEEVNGDSKSLFLR